MTIVLVGGGSGGHITPLLAIAKEIRTQLPHVRLVYIGERGGKFSDVAKESRLFDECRLIFAGKIRRYHGESFIRQLIDLPTSLLNIRDLFYLLIGSVQASVWFLETKPQVALLKGGFVTVPVALASKLSGTPTITHDSDTVPGLSNRFASRWASYHAVAMPVKYYNYPDTSIRVVGVPIDKNFSIYREPTAKLRNKYHIDPKSRTILLTGGSQGSRYLNKAFTSILPELIKQYPKIHIFHHVGVGNKDQYTLIDEKLKKHVTIFEFSDVMFEMSALSDVVITRAGATTMAEFAAQHKPCIIIPHPNLAGDHQSKNAKVFEDLKAGIVITQSELDDNYQTLFDQINHLLADSKERKRLREAIATLDPLVPSARALADIVVELGSSRK